MPHTEIKVLKRKGVDPCQGEDVPTSLGSPSQAFLEDGSTLGDAAGRVAELFVQPGRNELLKTELEMLLQRPCSF